MAFTRPKLSAIVARIQGDLNSSLTAAGYTADARIRRSLLWVLSYMTGGAAHILHGVLEWVTRQILPTTSDDEQLVRQAAIYGLTKNPATQATGSIRFTGVSGTVIPAGTQLVRSDGTVYETTAEGTLAMSEATVAAEAVDAGDAGNMELATELTLVSPIAGADNTATAAAGGDDWSTGADIETTDALRTRLLARIANTPQGGAADDYVAWAREVSGVTRARCIPTARGAGTVDVVFLHEEGTGVGIPSGGQIAAVQAHLDEVAPVTDDVLALAPTEVPVDYTFDSLTPDNPTMRTAIQAELEAMFAAKALATNDLSPTELAPSESYLAVSGVTGLTGFDISVPAAPVPIATDEVLTLGVITWPS